MSGAIIPAPLAMPAIATGTPSIEQEVPAAFGKVSVVAMARAAFSQEAEPSAAAAFGSAASSGGIGNGSPMTPVEETNT